MTKTIIIAAFVGGLAAVAYASFKKTFCPIQIFGPEGLVFTEEDIRKLESISGCGGCSAFNGKGDI